MIDLRPSEARGRANLGWLDSRHTFSFSNYHDPTFMGFRSLRVINEDRVRAGYGFDMHSHQDVEVITVILEGELEHRDSLGKKGVLKAGDVQLISAGTGIAHSEFNRSKDQDNHFLQIWILPEKRGTPPRYSQTTFPKASQLNRFATLVSGDGRDGSLELGQDARILAAGLEAGKKLSHELIPGRHAWIQVTGGKLSLLGKTLKAGDGAGIVGERRLDLEALEDSAFLLFDLA